MRVHECHSVILKLKVMDLFEGITDEKKWKIIRDEFKEVLKPFAKTIRKQLKKAMTDCNGTGIFQRRYVRISNDDKRRQIIGSGVSRYKFVNAIMSNLRKRFENAYRIHPSILVSDAGCMSQDVHFDYNPKMKRWKEGFFAIVAVEDGTKLIVNDNGYHLTTVYLNRGDIFVGRGDCLHAGAPYDLDNVRIHYYFDVNVKGLYLRKIGDSYFLTDDEAKKYHFPPPEEQVPMVDMMPTEPDVPMVNMLKSESFAEHLFCSTFF